MPWYEKIVPETVKKSVCAYLLQRYLGQFFEEKLTRDQLSVDLYNGTGSVEKIRLDVEALNELGEKQNWPFEFVDGFIEKLNISIPWSSILKDSSYVEVNGLKITVQPKQRNDDVTSMFESMWNSMSSSLKLAEECAKQDSKNSTQEEQAYEGLELFAKTIDSVLSRVKVKFVNTVIQIEHVPKDSIIGVGIYINIDLIEYADEAGNDPPGDEFVDAKNDDGKKAYVVQTFTTKNFSIEGVTVSTIEFSSKARTFSRSMMSSVEDPDGDIFKEMPSSHDDADDEAGKPSDINHQHVVPFAKFTNRQEIRVSLKQSDHINAPKVSITFNLGPLILYLSPRQLHVLLELAAGLASPDKGDHSNVPQKSRCTEKPMTSVDYQRIESDLQQQMQPHLQVPGLKGIRGWSGAPLEESDTEDNFLPMKNVTSGMFDSTLSVASSSMDSSYNSNLTGSFSEHASGRSRRRSANIESDPTAEISHFQIRLASVSAVLLHEDLLNVDLNTHTLIEASVQQMKTNAEEFFDKLNGTEINEKEPAKITNAFDKACSLNHIRLIAAPLVLEAHEKTTLTSFSISGHLTAAKLELIECLYGNSKNDIDYIPLLHFQDQTINQTSGQVKPPLHVTFKYVEKVTRSSISKRSIGPKTDINFYLGKCAVEFDITIIDRITTLMNPPTICIIDRKNIEHLWPPLDDPLKVGLPDSCTEIKVNSPQVTVKLRFPIPDYRPAHDLNRVPWWKRHIRPDYMTFILSDFLFQTLSHSKQCFREYTAQSRGIEAFYSESENAAPIVIAKTGCSDTYLSSLQDVLQNPRVSVKIYPQNKQLELEEQQQEDVMNQSVFCGGFVVKDSGPFSSKKVVHESDIPHEKHPQEETAELIIPGDKEEIEEFLKSATDSSLIQIDITIPLLSMQFVSKHIYELIYNRINNDLLLWESTAPKPKTSNVQIYDNPANFGNFGNPPINQEIFTTCKSGVQYESESDSDDVSEEDGAILFYSAYDRHKTATMPQPVIEVKKQSYLSLNLNVSNGILSFNTPVRDTSTCNVIPNQKSDFMIALENMSVFLINGYKGDKDLGYVCVQIGNAQMYHCDMMPSIPKFNPLREIGGAIEKHLHPTIYKSDKGALVDLKHGGGNREMITVAVKIEARHETHHVKTVRIAVGLNKATLKHRMCNEPNTWISQLLDFFKVEDYPIPGYNAKEVLTELHIHMWDCAIDYRPLYLPIRAAITLGYFSMTSHLSAKSNASTLRFIAEDCFLYLSDKAPAKDGVAATVPVDLKRDYINVISLGLFELSLKINDKKSQIYPHIDLRASNDCIHIYTCSDTGRALTQLITYIATDGDLKTTDSTVNTDSAYSSPRHNPSLEPELISIEQPQEVSKLTTSQHQQVNDLLGEAMEEMELENCPHDDVAFYNTGAKLFFFPDENQPIHDLVKPLPQVVRELGDVTSPSSGAGYDSDEDFCIIGDEAGLGIFPKNGVPEIRWLTADVVRIVENHFCVPVGKKDLLKAPKDFPIPKYKYTLCEMNIIWHMYGGSDFKSTKNELVPKKMVNFCDTRLGDSVAFSNTKREVSFSSRVEKEVKMSWRSKGGANRNHKVLMELELNKVKFQHEIYPETTKQASRQVLLISELEIRDILATSEFNKFLYQYTSEAKPRQSQAHMIVIKATHIRPDSNLNAEECCLRLSLLPLRFNIDQDSLKFLINFFSELGGNLSEDENLNSCSKHTTPTHQPPIMTISTNKDESENELNSSTEDNLLLLMEDNFKEKTNTAENSAPTSNVSPPVYFRNILFSPDVPIKIDYQGKHVDMADTSFAGLLIGLIMGLGQLNCSELRLKRISYRHGILGLEKLVAFLLQEWLSDIKKNQLPSLLSGVGPIHSLVQLFQGVKDLFWLPIEQYQKDGRIVRGLQRGANSFTTSTAMAALELTSRLIHLIQLTAETAYDMLSPGPSVRRRGKIKGKRKRYNQPQDLREGVANAYLLVKEGLGETAGTIVEVASHEHQQKGYSGAVGGVLRQIPPTILKPIIIATKATDNVLGGMKYQLLPDARNEANQKWRSKDE